MYLPSVRDLQVAGKSVLLRTNYDVPLIRSKDSNKQNRGEKYEVSDGTRIEESVKTIELLIARGAEKIIIVSHLGRPGGKRVEELSLRPVADYLNKLLKIKDNKQKLKIKKFESYGIGNKVVLIENMRFWPGEEENDEGFARQLAELGDVYVNDAFAGSHRKHASIVGIPRYLPAAFGLDMLEEVETLSRVRQEPKRPVTLILGGGKGDKLKLAARLVKWADVTLIGGLLADQAVLAGTASHEVVMADLREDKKDITLESVEKFEKLINRAETIVWAGPMGDFYQADAEEGTRKVAEAIAANRAFKVIGGGDTETALTKFGLVEKIDYVCSGGGAMLEFLVEGSLPGIEAITKQAKTAK